MWNSCLYFSLWFMSCDRSQTLSPCPFMYISGSELSPLYTTPYRKWPQEVQPSSNLFSALFPVLQTQLTEVRLSSGCVISKLSLWCSYWQPKKIGVIYFYFRFIRLLQSLPEQSKCIVYTVCIKWSLISYTKQYVANSS